VVPLPDGKSIPVKGMGTKIQVNINNQTGQPVKGEQGQVHRTTVLFITLLREVQFNVNLSNAILRNEFQSGYVVTRAKFTRLVNKWHVVYRYITDTDKSTLETFENNVKVGTDAFYWTEPATSTQKTVRFLAPIHYAKASLYWNC